MTVLTDRKVGWIYGQLDVGELSVRRIAKFAGVTPRRVRQLREFLQRTGRRYALQKVRQVRCRVPSREEKVRVVYAYSQWKLGATFLERIFRRQNTVIPHNLIQRILNEAELGVRLDKKVKRKDWVRYERKHSNAMWHIDWTTLDGRWLIAFQDDASRKIVGWGVFDAATTKNSIQVLEEAIKTHGTPKSILTGRDVQFYSSDKKGVASEPNDFQKYLAEHEIEHVLARVNHPQTNGKIERFFGEVKRKIHLFSSPDELVHWYNEIKPHMSLDWENLETPSQAFKRKMHHKQREQLEALTLEVKQ